MRFSFRVWRIAAKPGGGAAMQRRLSPGLQGVTCDIRAVTARMRPWDRNWVGVKMAGIRQNIGVVDPATTLACARRVLALEAEAVADLASRLDVNFHTAVMRMLACRGRVVVTGMGKSGLIGRKAAATLASTGTPAFFLHAAEGSHGDLGMVTGHDVVLALSNSGETPEVLQLLPAFKRLGATVVALVGQPSSTLGRLADVVLDMSVSREACPLNLAPTSSTTAALALCDALAIALLEARGFHADQFALLHPGGTLGRRLLLRVADVMRTGEDIPTVDERTPLHQAIIHMSEKRMGMTGVLDSNRRLRGIITDGDLRRLLQRDEGVLNHVAADVMTPHPRTIAAQALAAQAIRLMEDARITTLFVVDDAGDIQGALHLHDLLEAGLS
ncbi:MAG: KpsF/GutQ family sugar-phosphate isomerase [Magnetococcus sp. WYHC-3]